jgi:hypothetical protein
MMRRWHLWPVGSCSSTTLVSVGGAVGRRMDATIVATTTTLLLVAPRRASRRLACVRYHN